MGLGLEKRVLAICLYPGKKYRNMAIRWAHHWPTTPGPCADWLVCDITWGWRCLVKPTQCPGLDTASWSCTCSPASSPPITNQLPGTRTNQRASLWAASQSEPCVLSRGGLYCCKCVGECGQQVTVVRALIVVCLFAG